MKAASTAQVVVESGGNQVAAHAGLHALGSFADRLGLGTVISNAIIRATRRLPLPDSGKVMAHLLLLLAGGGKSGADSEHLRAQRLLFPDVCLDSTLHRGVRQLRLEVLAAVEESVAQIRATVWHRRPSVWRNEGVLDFDASLLQIHSENKERTTPTYEGGFGFHPSSASSTAPGTPSAPCSGPAWPAPPWPRTTRSCWTWPSPPCQRCSKATITAVAIPS